MIAGFRVQEKAASSFVARFEATGGSQIRERGKPSGRPDKKGAPRQRGQRERTIELELRLGLRLDRVKWL